MSALAGWLPLLVELRTYADAHWRDRTFLDLIDHLHTTQGVGLPKPLDEFLLASLQGTAHYALALANRDPRAAGQAVPLLHQTVDGFGPDRARTHVLYLPDLAGAHALSGDTDTAITVGHQAIDAVTALHSPRAYDRIQVLNTALEPLHTSAGVAELRDRLISTAA